MSSFRAFMETSAESVRLYNASTVENDPEGWLEPHISDWVREVAQGAVDGDIEEYLRPLIYLSDNPTKWIRMIVGRKVNKHPNSVTDRDIIEHGRINIVDVDIDTEDVFLVGDYHMDGKVTTLSGERVYHPYLDELPIGPEPPDYIAHDALELTSSLTGDSLAKFLGLEGSD